MPNPTNSIPTNPRMAAVHTFGHPSAAPPRTGWVQRGRGAAASPGVPRQTPLLPAAPNGLSLSHGSGSDLLATWSAPSADATHGAATSYNLRFGPSGAGIWTGVVGVTSPYTLSGLTAGAAYDVQIQSANATGPGPWSATTTLSTTASGPFAPNAPSIASLAASTDGTNSKLRVAWTAPAVDGTHGAATAYNLRFSPTGTGTWTTVTGVTSPYPIAGLSGAAGIDVQVQGTNAAASPGAWSATSTGTTWGATVAPGGWVPATSQTHGASVAPNGGAQLVAVAAPTTVTGAAFAWSASNATVPTSGLISATGDGQANGWGQWFNAPATAGTYYLWLLAQGTGGVTTGALVTGPITVT